MTRCPSQDWDNYCNMMDGPEECPVCGKPNYDEDDDKPICAEHPDFCSPECAAKYEDQCREEAEAEAAAYEAERKGEVPQGRAKQYAEVSLDEPDAYVGDGDDGVYVGVGEGPDGWYASTVVDSDTGSFVDSLVTDDGPYPTEAEALEAGKNAGREWCYTNNVATGDPDPDCYGCLGTGKIQGFGHTGEECPCTTAKPEP